MIGRFHTHCQMAPETIRAQMQQILASDGFVRSPRMRRFLQFIVEETLAGRADQLGEYSIGTAVFDRGEDFEPGLDPIVRNDARRLRLSLLEYYRRPGPRNLDHITIEMPKGGYVPVFLPLGNGGPIASFNTCQGTGERFRIVVNLVRAIDGSQLWAGEFEIQAQELMNALPNDLTVQAGLRRRETALALAA